MSRRIVEPTNVLIPDGRGKVTIIENDTSMASHTRTDRRPSSSARRQIGKWRWLVCTTQYKNSKCILIFKANFHEKKMRVKGSRPPKFRQFQCLPHYSKLEKKSVFINFLSIFIKGLFLMLGNHASFISGRDFTDTSQKFITQNWQKYLKYCELVPLS